MNATIRMSMSTLVITLLVTSLFAGESLACWACSSENRCVFGFCCYWDCFESEELGVSMCDELHPGCSIIVIERPGRNGLVAGALIQLPGAVSETVLADSVGAEPGKG